MACNKLKLNRDKTEFLVIHAKHRPRPPIGDIKIAGVRVVPTESAQLQMTVENQYQSNFSYQAQQHKTAR